MSSEKPTIFLIYYFYLSVFSVIISRNVQGLPIGQLEDNNLAIDYMAKYGYISEVPGGEGAQSLLAKTSSGGILPVYKTALRLVQRYGGLSETGELDQQTIQLMKSQRCGLPDILNGSTSSEPEEDDGETDQVTMASNGHQSWHHHHHHHKRHYHEQGPWSLRRNRTKRYILASGGWDKRNLYYYLENLPRGLGRDEVLTELKTALDAWARYGRLGFRQTDDPRRADITFAFYGGQHGDRYPFDGPGSVLAHAFFPGTDPRYEGDVHFDAEENWKIKLRPYESGVELYPVVLHELGHSLGLSHSDRPGSVMNPFYRAESRDLGYDDQRAMYRLYGQKRLRDDNTADGNDAVVPPVPRLPTSPRTTERPRLADRRPSTSPEEAVPSSTTPPRQRPLKPQGAAGSWAGRNSSLGCFGGFDVVALIRNELFVIKDKMLWRLRGPGQIQPGYPVDFHRFFHKLPSSVERIDAIYQREHDSRIIIFTGPEYWLFDGTDFVEGSPRRITDFGLPESISRLDAAASVNNTALLFVGGNYWSYDDLHRRPLGAPRSVSDFGLPSPIDSALTYTDGRTYFFKDDYYWIYEANTAIPKRKKHASDYWLNC